MLMPYSKPGNDYNSLPQIDIPPQHNLCTDFQCPKPKHKEKGRPATITDVKLEDIDILATLGTLL